jgi:ribonuclease P protein subunit POP4
MEKRDFMKQEFIGLEVEVVSSAHPEYRVCGVVVDESKNTFSIEHAGKARTIPKKGNGFQFTYGSERITVMGSEIQHRPEDRIKKTR